MAVVLTSTQIPQDSILDINGRQTYLGNTFILPMPGAALTDTTETPVAVITNPAASGKTLFLFNRGVLSDKNAAQFRYYLNPTLNVPGTAKVAKNIRSGSTTTSISLNYLGATITSNGTLLSVLSAGTTSFLSKLLFVLDQGDKLLITAQQTGAGTSNVYTENVWYEI